MFKPFTVKKERLVTSKWTQTDPRVGEITDAPGQHTEPERVLGPIPIPWLCLAADISGTAAYLGVICWHLTKLRKGPVALTPTVCEKYHIPLRSRSRLLFQLEDAGLVLVERKPSHAPRVTLVSLDARKPKKTRSAV
jgi:hypothetical protein